MELVLIDVVILFHNKVDQTINCINSFIPSGLQIYVLNNDSDPVQEIKLKEYFKEEANVHLLNAGKNLGPAGGRNFLIEHTNSQWLFFVDNDITIKHPNGWITKFSDYLKSHPTADIICPRIYNVHEGCYMERLNLVVLNNVLSLKHEKGSVTNFFPEGGSIVRRTLFDRLGLYDAEMFAFEGYDLALRALLSDYGAFEVHHNDHLELIHDHRFQKSSKDKEAVRQRYNREKMKASYDRLISKHDIVFEHDWLWWTNNQLDLMTEPKLFRKIKQKIRNILIR